MRTRIGFLCFFANFSQLYVSPRTFKLAFQIGILLRLFMLFWASYTLDAESDFLVPRTIRLTTL